MWFRRWVVVVLPSTVLPTADARATATLSMASMSKANMALSWAVKQSTLLFPAREVVLLENLCGSYWLQSKLAELCLFIDGETYTSNAHSLRSQSKCSSILEKRYCYKWWLSRHAFFQLLQQDLTKKKATFSLDFGEGKQLVKNEAIARFFVSFQKKAMNVTRIF